MTGHFVRSTFVQKITSPPQGADGSMPSAGLKSPAGTGTEVYFITYKTCYRKEEVLASGMVYVPLSPAALPLLSIQHGTLFCKADAPTQQTPQLSMYHLADMGFIVLAPDYLGYGCSARLFHPYYDYQHSATAVIDFMDAVREFLQLRQISFNNNLFLAGFSEGGYVTLATQKVLQSGKYKHITLKAVAAGAGGYDLFQMLGNVTQGNKQHTQPSYLVYLLMAYESMYQWNKTLDYYFDRKYAAMLPELFSGKYSGDYINAHLTPDLKELFNPQFYSNLTGSGEMELKKALYANSLSNWTPQAPLRLYHGTEDATIPFANSEVTYKSFLEKNAASVKFIPVPGGTHDNTSEPMLLDALPWFRSLQS